MRQVLLLGVAAAALVACKSGGGSHDAGAVVEDDTAAIERGKGAMAALGQELAETLQAAMKKGGPVAAIGACSAQAQALAAKHSEKSGITLGRTSHHLRNASNLPRPWAEDAVRAGAGKKVGQVAIQTFDLGSSVGVLVPIGTKEICTVCHGSVDSQSAELKEALKAAYPLDQAVGFQVGELRGWFWAEVPKS